VATASRYPLTIDSSGVAFGDAESYNKEPTIIPAEIRAEMRRRNPKDRISLRGFKPSSDRILVRDIDEWKRRRDFPDNIAEFRARYPNARGYVEAWLPGYSKDGQAAVMRGGVGPLDHGAVTTYMVVKKARRWAVLWRSVAHFV
jgi:hypothetical protein